MIKVNTSDGRAFLVPVDRITYEHTRGRFDRAEDTASGLAILRHAVMDGGLISWADEAANTIEWVNAAHVVSWTEPVR